MRTIKFIFISSSAETWEDGFEVEDTATDTEIYQKAENQLKTKWSGSGLNLVNVLEVKGNKRVKIEKPSVVNVDVHVSHCCKVHGCEYSSGNCPVETGQVEQDYPCESCDYVGIEDMGMLNSIIKLSEEVKQLGSDDEYTVDAKTLKFLLSKFVF